MSRKIYGKKNNTQIMKKYEFFSNYSLPEMKNEIYDCHSCYCSDIRLIYL